MKLRFLKRVFSTTNGVWVIAVILTAASAAWALDIPKGSIRTEHLHNSAVTSAKIKARTISKSDVNMGAIYGEHVREGTLGTVPKATDSDNLGGEPDDAYVKVNTDTTIWSPANTAFSAENDVVITPGVSGVVDITTSNGNDSRQFTIAATTPESFFGTAWYIKGFRYCYATSGSVQITTAAIGVLKTDTGTVSSTGTDQAVIDTAVPHSSTNIQCIDSSATPLYEAADAPAYLIVNFTANSSNDVLRIFGFRITYTNTQG